MFPRPCSSAQRRAVSLSLCQLLFLQLCLQTITIQPVNGDIDFWTKLKLIGLLALTNKISIVPIPMPIPVPIHLEGKDEVVFVKAPPPISSAYSYMAPPMLEYGHSPYSSNRGVQYSPKGYGDVVGHASELVPMVAAASVRYGDRISPSGASHAHSPAPSPTHAPAQRPLHRGRAHRNRNLGRPKGEYTPQSTTPAPAQPPPSAALPIEDYSYRTPYEPEVNKPQVETMKIAIIPVKASELGGVSEQTQPQAPKESSDSSVLPENLLNYIRQVQGLTLSDSENNKATQPVQSAKPNESSTSSEAVSDSADKLKVNESATTASPIEVSTPALAPTPSSVLSQYQSQYQSPFSIQHQQQSFNPITVQTAPVLSPIQSQWQHNFQSSVGVTSTTQYRPPELKVIRTRYNPKAHLEQVRSQPATPTIGPLSSLNSVNSYQESPSVSAAMPPQQTQFIYSVSHQAYNPPSTSFYSAPNNYASNLDNFGLSAFRQSQLKQTQDTKPSFVSSPLTAAASVESGTWVKPNEKGKTKFLNNVGHRLSHFF